MKKVLCPLLVSPRTEPAMAVAASQSMREATVKRQCSGVTAGAYFALAPPALCLPA